MNYNVQAIKIVCVNKKVEVVRMFQNISKDYAEDQFEDVKLNKKDNIKNIANANKTINGEKR